MIYKLFLFLGPIIFTLIAFYFIIKYNKKNIDLRNERKLIAINYEKELFKSQLEIQEQTFQFISREIHDNIGQQLSLSKLLLNTINFEDNKIAIRGVKSSADILTLALEDLRDLSKSLSTQTIKNEGLINVIEWQVQQLKKFGIFQISFLIEGNYFNLNDQTELVLFRIFQEVINNIIRHSNATKISILLHYFNNTLVMTIKDNGKGFRYDKLKKENPDLKAGLSNLVKRAELINAKINIESVLENGTSVIVEISIIE